MTSRKRVLKYKINFPSHLPAKVQLMRGRDIPSSPLTYHPEIEIQCIRKGAGSYFIGGHAYRFRKNSLLIIRPNEIHRLILSPDTYIDKTSLTVTPSFLNRSARIRRLLEEIPHHLRLSETAATEVEIILHTVQAEELRPDVFTRQLLIGELDKLSILLTRLSRTRRTTPRENKLVSDITAYVEAHFRDYMTVNAIAAKFHYSQEYLSRHFKKYTGLGLKQYVIERRIMEAKRLLREESFTKAHVIAEKVGFRDFGVFNRDFKLITGLTPTSYRRMSQRKDGP